MPGHKNKKPHTSLVLQIMQFAFVYLGPLFPEIMGRWAYRLWFSPTRFKMPQHETEANDSGERSSISVNNMDISVLSWGEGPVVLFVHGWMGRGTQAGYFLHGLISAGYRVISFDAPAHGKTAGRQTSVFEIADVIHELNRRYGPFEAAITHSFGGMTLAYAMKSGVSVNKVVNICPIADLDTLISNFRNILCIPDSVTRIMLGKLTDAYGPDLPEKISATNNVKNLTAKALVIHDENDEDIPWQSGKAIADAWKDSRFVLTRNLGHRRILRDPETVRLAVDFIISES